MISPYGNDKTMLYNDDKTGNALSKTTSIKLIVCVRDILIIFDRFNWSCPKKINIPASFDE